MPGSTFFNPPFAVRDPLLNGPALGVIGTTSRAHTAQGPVARQTDVLVFAPLGTAAYIGVWTVANRRTYVGGVATISQSNSGVAIIVPPVPPPSIVGPIYPTVGAPRLQTR